MNRTVVTNDIEIRIRDNGSMFIKGMLPTNSLSHTLYNKKKRRFFKEMILPGAFEEVISKKTPKFLLQHDYKKEQQLISFNGKEKERLGYCFEAEIIPTQELISNIDKVNGLSFEFISKSREEEWGKIKGQFIRKIKSFAKINEISILYGECIPAYPASRVFIGENEKELSENEIQAMKKTVCKMRYEQMKERLKELRN